MPKIFEYLGILIFFYSNEHEPIHVMLFNKKMNFYKSLSHHLTI